MRTIIIGNLVPDTSLNSSGEILFNELMQQADQALYQAKAQRNCVVVYESAKLAQEEEKDGAW